MRTLTITAMLLTAMSCTSQRVWDITDYGAIGDDLSDNTLAINLAISLCSKAGGGTVLIPEGDFVSGTGTANQNCASESSWCRALIIAANTSGAAILGYELDNASFENVNISGS